MTQWDDDIRALKEALLYVNDPATPRTREIWAKAAAALLRIELHQCGLPDSIIQALNSGDGSYHP